MPLFEWKGKLKVAIGELTRKGQLDLWLTFRDSEWFSEGAIEGMDLVVRYYLETDQMVAAASTRALWVCEEGEWVQVKEGETVFVDEGDGVGFKVSYPVSYADLLHFPRTLVDQWVQYSTEENGQINDLFVFFTSQSVMSGKVNNAPPSAVTPSS